MANFGESFSRSFNSGYELGNKMMDRKALKEYESEVEAAKQARDAALDKTGAVEQAAGLNAEQKPGSYADDYEPTPQEEKVALEASKNFRTAADDANRDYEYARKGALAKYHTKMGNVVEAEKANEQLERSKWSRDWWSKLKGNSSAYDDQMIADLNSDTIAKVQGIQYSKDKSGNLVMTQNGKVLGQPIPITNQMRSPFLQNMYATEFGRTFNSEPTPQDMMGWEKRKTALSSALSDSAKQKETERHHRAVEKIAADRVAKMGGSIADPTQGQEIEFDETTGIGTIRGNGKAGTMKGDVLGRFIGTGEGRIFVNPSLSKESAKGVADGLSKAMEVYSDLNPNLVTVNTEGANGKIYKQTGIRIGNSNDVSFTKEEFEKYYENLKKSVGLTDREREVRQAINGDYSRYSGGMPSGMPAGIVQGLQTEARNKNAKAFK